MGPASVLTDIFSLRWLRSWSLSWGRKDGWKYMGANFFPGLRNTIDHHSDSLWKDLEDVCDFGEFILWLSNMKMVFCLWLPCHWHHFSCAQDIQSCGSPGVRTAAQCPASARWGLTLLKTREDLHTNEVNGISPVEWIAVKYFDLSLRLSIAYLAVSLRNWCL